MTPVTTVWLDWDATPHGDDADDDDDEDEAAAAAAAADDDDAADVSLHAAATVSGELSLPNATTSSAEIMRTV